MENIQGSQPPFLDDGEERLLPIALTELPAGKSGTVNQLNGDKEFVNRVASLGFTSGAQVTVLHNQNQGPMIVSVLGAHIALGHQEANLIQVLMQ